MEELWTWMLRRWFKIPDDEQPSGSGALPFWSWLMIHIDNPWDFGSHVMIVMVPYFRAIWVTIVTLFQDYPSNVLTATCHCAKLHNKTYPDLAGRAWSTRVSFRNGKYRDTVMIYPQCLFFHGGTGETNEKSLRFYCLGPSQICVEGTMV